MDKKARLARLQEERAAYFNELYAPDQKVYVFGDGDPQARVMLVGEAPGAQEALLGKPFVGKAGKNLDEFLERTQLKRAELYITNTVKFRPVKISDKGRASNRTPTREEIGLFLPWLQREIDLIEPQLIVSLGNVPLQALLGRRDTIGQMHGRVISDAQCGRPLFALYHPASVIYNPSLREVYLHDLDTLKEVLRMERPVGQLDAPRA